MRKRQYRDLEAHLYWNGSVYVYRKPDGKPVSLGTSKTKANEASRRANRILYPGDLYQRIMGEEKPPIAKICDRYWTEFLTGKKKDGRPRYSTKTLADLKHKLGVVRRKWGSFYPDHLSVLKVANFVDSFPGRQSERYAQFLRMFFKWGKAKGFFDQNLAADLITEKAEVQRDRLSRDGYEAAYAYAEPWLQRAMHFALQSLIRREDIVLCRFDEYRDGVLPYCQQKTGNHVRILVGPELERAIRACRDDTLSPFIVHKKPVRITKKSRELRQHHTQVLEDQLTRAFRDAREASGFYDGWPSLKKPSFHEIRALGAKLYEDAGIDPQPLLGHKDAASTRIYLDRHRIEWIEAAGGLTL